MKLYNYLNIRVTFSIFFNYTTSVAFTTFLVKIVNDRSLATRIYNFNSYWVIQLILSSVSLCVIF